MTASLASDTSSFQSTPYEIGDIAVDVMIRDEPKFQVAVTQHPVERGANIADHARPQLVTLTLEGLISSLGDGDPDAADTYFRSICGKPVVISVSTRSGFYAAMVVTAYTPKYSKTHGRSLHFVLELIEFRVVNTRTQTVRVVQAKQSKLGKKPPEQATPTPHQSFADKALFGKAQAGAVTVEELQRGQSLPTQHAGTP